MFMLYSARWLVQAARDNSYVGTFGEAGYGIRAQQVLGQVRGSWIEVTDLKGVLSLLIVRTALQRGHRILSGGVVVQRVHRNKQRHTTGT